MYVHSVNVDQNAFLTTSFCHGSGRIIMETAIPPVIIPMWLTGFDKLMPLGRHFPFNYFPRLGVHLSVTFGNPISSEKIKNALGTLCSDHIPGIPSHSEVVSGNERMSGWMGAEGAQKLNRKTVDEEIMKRKNLVVTRVRSDVTAIVQRAVEALGRSMSGDLLQASVTRPGRLNI